MESSAGADHETASETFDVVVLGSGAAGCSAALKAARGGLKVLVLEKSALLGGTSAMSGAGIWIPANHLAAEAGIADSPEEAISYICAVAPENWARTEDALWLAFVDAGPRMVRFLVENTPLKFRLTREPDPFAEAAGGKAQGRMMSVGALPRRIIGRHAWHLRRSTLPHSFVYQELSELDVYHHPFRAGLKILPQLLWRWLSGARGQGTALMAGLIKGCLDAGVFFRRGTRAVRLMQDTDMRVIGVEAEHRGRKRTILAGRGVVLATGGFEWNEEMRSRHFPGPIDHLGSPACNEGDGQRMAAEVGAQLDRMDQANIYPCLPTRYEGLSYGLPITFQTEPHSIVVDRHARRFVSETDFNIGEALDARDPDGTMRHLPCYLVGDHRFLKTSPAFRWYASYRRDWVKKADTVAGLAAQLGLSAAALEETVERWNAYCAAGRDEDFHRGEGGWNKGKAHGTANKLYPIDSPPYIGLEFNRCILGTKGGARTNEHAQVRRPDGSIIAGLYAAGLAMANPFGTRAIGAGTTLGPNLTWGFIAGETILNQNR